MKFLLFILFVVKTTISASDNEPRQNGIPQVMRAGRQIARAGLNGNDLRVFSAIEVTMLAFQLDRILEKHTLSGEKLLKKRQIGTLLAKKLAEWTVPKMESALNSLKRSLVEPIGRKLAEKLESGLTPLNTGWVLERVRSLARMLGRRQFSRQVLDLKSLRALGLQPPEGVPPEKAKKFEWELDAYSAQIEAKLNAGELSEELQQQVVRSVSSLSTYEENLLILSRLLPLARNLIRRLLNKGTVNRMNELMAQGGWTLNVALYMDQFDSFGTDWIHTSSQMAESRVLTEEEFFDLVQPVDSMAHIENEMDHFRVELSPLDSQLLPTLGELYWTKVKVAPLDPRGAVAPLKEVFRILQSDSDFAEHPKLVHFVQLCTNKYSLPAEFCEAFVQGPFYSAVLDEMQFRTIALKMGPDGGEVIDFFDEIYVHEDVRHYEHQYLRCQVVIESHHKATDELKSALSQVDGFDEFYANCRETLLKVQRPILQFVKEGSDRSAKSTKH